jgi:hypothetical protein
MPGKQLLFLFLLLLPALAGAQVHRAYTRAVPEMQFLLKGAWQYNTLTESGFTPTYASGWAAGLGVKIPFNRIWWMQPEILLSQRAASLKYPASGSTAAYAVDFSFRYVDIPLLLSFKPNTIVEFQLGPQMSTLVRHAAAATAGQRNPDLPPSELARWDISLAGGLELNVSPLAFGARYVHGFRELATTDLARQWLGNAKLQGFQLYGALVF